MEVKVTKDNVCITNPVAVNSGEYMVNTCKFILPRCFEGLVVSAVFNKTPVPLTGDSCYIPALKKGTHTLGVYAYKKTGDEVELMYSPRPATFFVGGGSYVDDPSVEEIPSVSEFEKYCAAVSALTFPKSSVITEFDVEKEYDSSHVLSVGALQSVLEMYSAEIVALRNYSDKLNNESEKISRRVTNVDASSTDDTYPTAKAVYDCTDSVRKSVSAEIERIEMGVSSVGGDIKVLTNKDSATNKRVDDAFGEIEILNTEVEGVKGAVTGVREDVEALNISLEKTDSDLISLSEDINESHTGIAELQNSIEETNNHILQVESQMTGGVFGYANALKGYVEGEGSVEINDISPVKHFFDIKLKSDTITDFSGVSLTSGSKNIFNISERSLRAFGYSGVTNTRELDGKSVYLAVSGTNAYKHNSGTLKYNESTGTLQCDVVYAMYGPGFDIAVEPQTKYSVSVKEFSANGRISIAYYNSSGEFISYDTLRTSQTITTPVNAVWMVVIFTSSVNNSTVYFSDIQVEKSAEITPYTPYAPEKTVVSASNGLVEGIMSYGSYIKLWTNTPEVTVSVEYNRDINVAFNSLKSAIETLGVVV